MFLLSLTATCQVCALSLKAGLYTYNWPAADCLQPALRCGFRQQLRPGVRCQSHRRKYKRLAGVAGEEGNMTHGFWYYAVLSIAIAAAAFYIGLALAIMVRWYLRRSVALRIDVFDFLARQLLNDDQVEYLRSKYRQI
jgi:hypothetical protein